LQIKKQALMLQEQNTNIDISQVNVICYKIFGNSNRVLARKMVGNDINVLQLSHRISFVVTEIHLGFGPVIISRRCRELTHIYIYIYILKNILTKMLCL